MLFFDIIFDTKLYTEINFLFLLFLFLITTIITYLTKSISNQNLISNNMYNLVKLIIMFSLIISFLLHLINFWSYIFSSYNTNLNLFNNTKILNNNIIELTYTSESSNLKKNYELIPFLNKFSLNISLDLYGFVLITLAYIVGVISLLTLDSRLY